jgi:hypothetical protein
VDLEVDRVGARRLPIDNGIAMSAILPEPGLSRTGREGVRGSLRRRAVLPWVVSGPDALLVAAFLILGVRLLTRLPADFGIDSWLELTAGRMIWHVGIPHYETLTAVATGRLWIDQQWLAQLMSYSLYRLGGLGLLGVANVTLLMSGLAIAVTMARKLGASLRDVLLVLLPCGWLFMLGTEVRTQAFAVPLFALTVYLLALDSRKPSWRVLLTLPILVLWGNLHGSASLGAGLVALRGLTLLWEQREQLVSSPRRAGTALALILGAPLSLLLTPYGLRVIVYYHSILGNSALRHAVTEWQPVTASMAVAVPFFLVAGTMLWSFGRFSQRSTLWERLALIALAAGAIFAIRNVAFFALGALAILPVSLNGVLGSTPRTPAPLVRRLNSVLLGLALVLATGGVVATIAKPAAKLEGATRRPAMMAAIDSAAHSTPGLRIAADTRYGDWILWQAPWLAGRLDSDARYELYTSAELGRFQKLFAALGPDWKQAASGDRLLVLDRSADRDSVTGFLRERGARVLYADRDVIVILRSASLS